MHHRLFAVSCAILICFIVPNLSADDADPRVAIHPRTSQAPATAGPVSALIRENVRLVLVPVTVTDALNRPIRDLPKENFHILEDGVEQKITSFAREDGPVSMGLLFDSSGSMKNRIDASVAALRCLVRTSMPGDEFFLAQFSDDVRLLSRFTTEPEAIQQQLAYVQASGWTALLDAVALGIHEMKSARNARKFSSFCPTAMTTTAGSRNPKFEAG
jgi:Ca-activated chloride channel family protein